MVIKKIFYFYCIIWNLGVSGMFAFLYIRSELFGFPMWIAEPNKFIFYLELILTIIAILGLFPIAKKVILDATS